MPFAPYDRAMLDARFLCGSWASCLLQCVSTTCVNTKVSVSKIFSRGWWLYQ